MPDQYRQQTSTFRAVAMLLFPASCCYWWHLWLRPTLRREQRKHVICAQQEERRDFIPLVQQGLEPRMQMSWPLFLNVYDSSESSGDPPCISVCPSHSHSKRELEQSWRTLPNMPTRHNGWCDAGGFVYPFPTLFYFSFLKFIYTLIPILLSVLCLYCISPLFRFWHSRFFRSTDSRFTGQRDIMPCRLVCRCQRFGGTCCFCL
jgi:hypothetical protein